MFRKLFILLGLVSMSVLATDNREFLNDILNSDKRTTHRLLGEEVHFIEVNAETFQRLRFILNDDSNDTRVIYSTHEEFGHITIINEEAPAILDMLFY